MKLTNFIYPTNIVIKAILRTKRQKGFYECRKGLPNGKCYNDVINKIIAAARQKVLSLDLKDSRMRELNLIADIVSVSQSERSCPAADIVREITKLTNDDWKKDSFIIHVGIRYGCIWLSEEDIHAINERETK